MPQTFEGIEVADPEGLGLHPELKASLGGARGEDRIWLSRACHTTRGGQGSSVGPRSEGSGSITSGERKKTTLGRMGVDLGQRGG